MGRDLHKATSAAGMKSWKVLVVFRCTAGVTDAAGEAELQQAKQEPGTAGRISCLSAQHIGLCCPSCCSQTCLQLLLEGNRWNCAGSGGRCLTKLGLCTSWGRGNCPRDLTRGWKRNSQWLGQDWELLCSSHLHSTAANNTDGACTKAGKMLNCPLQTSSARLE